MTIYSLGLVRRRSRDVSRPQPTRNQGGPAMGEKTDKTIGRTKQAVGALTGDE
jgi:hypothetical protein